MEKLGNILGAQYNHSSLQDNLEKIKTILIRNGYMPVSVKIQHKKLIVTMDNHIAASELKMQRYKLLMKIQEVDSNITSIITTF